MGKHRKPLARKNKLENNKKRVVKFLEDMQWLFQVQNYERKLSIMKEDLDDKCAEVIFNEDYQRIQIKLFPCFFEQTLEEQRKALLHEFCHTITIPMNKLTIDFMSGKAVTEETVRTVHERSTSQIENIVDGLLRLRFAYARKGYNHYLKKL